MGPTPSRPAKIGTNSPRTWNGVRFRLPPAAVSVEVELLYQSASPRHLAEIFAWDDPLIRAFEAMAEAADPGPERVAAASVVFGR